MLNKVRQLKKEANGAKATGFTIIEVMIVLAIAGLIMAIVFLAIPGLQRSNRNTQRKADASRISSLINEYTSNNSGKLPTKITLGASSGDLDVTNDNFNILSKPTGTTAATSYAITKVAVAADITAIVPPTDDTKWQVYSNAVCGSNAGDKPALGTSARQFVIYWYTEGTAPSQCLAS